MENQIKTAGKTAMEWGKVCSCKFHFSNNDPNRDIRVCFLPGLARSVEKLRQWGYTDNIILGDNNSVTVKGDGGFEWIDFLGLLRSSGVLCTGITIQNKTIENYIFDQYFRLGWTVPGAKNKEIRIDLQDYVLTTAYDRSKIFIDMKENPLPLDGASYMSLIMPPNTDIIVTFHFY